MRAGLIVSFWLLHCPRLLTHVGEKGDNLFISAFDLKVNGAEFGHGLLQDESIVAAIKEANSLLADVDSLGI